DGNTTQVLARADYDVFGTPIIQAPADTVVNFGRFGYNGQEFQNDTKLVYSKARYYDPQSGRFISADPLGLLPDVNPYRYANNSPTNFTDPSGRFVNVAAAAVGGLVGGVIGGAIGGVTAYIESGGDWDATRQAAAKGVLLGATAGFVGGLT